MCVCVWEQLGLARFQWIWELREVPLCRLWMLNRRLFNESYRGQRSTPLHSSDKLSARSNQLQNKLLNFYHHSCNHHTRFTVFSSFFKIIWHVPEMWSFLGCGLSHRNRVEGQGQRCSFSILYAVMWVASGVHGRTPILPVKSFRTPTHSRVFPYFYYCRIIVKTSKLWNNTWNHVVTKKVLNKSKYISKFRFFKVATLCLDDSFAHSWHSLNQLHEEYILIYRCAFLKVNLSNFFPS